MLHRLPYDIQMYILDFVIPPPMKLLDWVDLEKINWTLLSRNPSAIELFRENPEKINWSYLSSNPTAIELLRANTEKIIWSCLSSNPAAIELLRANP